jgi:tyrosyl-tRNA synthetase
VELGGTDQKFNLLVGRELQRAYGQESQVVLTTRILEGTNGVQKMSKSLGNAIGIHEPPAQMYIKIMRISDELMWSYYELLTDVTTAEIETMKQESHPMEAKKALASRIVTDFHSAEAAADAANEWTNRDQVSEDDPHDVSFESLGKLIHHQGLADSVSDAVRKIKQGAVRLNGEVTTDPLARPNPDEIITLQVGKQKPRKLRVKLVPGTREKNKELSS